MISKFEDSWIRQVSFWLIVVMMNDGVLELFWMEDLSGCYILKLVQDVFG